MAILTGGTGHRRGTRTVKLENVTLKLTSASAKRIEVEKENSIIIDGAGSAEEADRRPHQAQIRQH